MIVFICTGNWFRSRFAAAYARHRGLHAISRGLDVARLKEENVDSTPVFGNTSMSMAAYQYLKQLGVTDDTIAIEKKARQFDPTTDWQNSSVCIGLYYKEHYPMLVNLLKNQYGDNPKLATVANRIMYWDIQDYPKLPGQKGYEDKLGGMYSEESLPIIKEKIDNFFCKTF